MCGLTSALTAICDWRGLGGIDLFPHSPQDRDNLVKTLGPVGWLDKVFDICRKQIKSEYGRNIGVVRSGGTLDQWLDRVRRAHGDTMLESTLDRWRRAIFKFFEDFDRSAENVNEGAFVIQLVGRLGVATQHRWYTDRLRQGRASEVIDLKSLTSEVREEYSRPRLPGTVLAPMHFSVLPFSTVSVYRRTTVFRVAQVYCSSRILSLHGRRAS